MRILGIDYGDSRIGVAVSDPFGWTAQGIETIYRNNTAVSPVKRIARLVDEYGAEKVVVGFPKNMNDTVGPRGKETQEFINMLKKRLKVEVVSWDERLTTVAANRVMHETGTKISKKKHIVDMIAATYILQGYLDSLKK